MGGRSSMRLPQGFLPASPAEGVRHRCQPRLSTSLCCSLCEQAERGFLRGSAVVLSSHPLKGDEETGTGYIHSNWEGQGRSSRGFGTAQKRSGRDVESKHLFPITQRSPYYSGLNIR